MTALVFILVFSTWENNVAKIVLIKQLTYNIFQDTLSLGSIAPIAIRGFAFAEIASSNDTIVRYDASPPGINMPEECANGICGHRFVSYDQHVNTKGFTYDPFINSLM